MKLKSLKVKNYICFKEAILPLDRVGVTKVTGKNLDSNTKLAPAGDDTNAVGKTALLSGIPQLVFASNPMTQDIKTKAKKDAFKTKGASIELVVEPKDNKIYTLQKLSKGKSTQFAIHKGSENTNVRTQAYPEEKIRQMFDMTEDEFYTLWFISSSKPSRIQYGSAASRLQFFTNFFRLNNYDEVRKIFNGMLRKAKDAKIALAEVATHIESLNLKDEARLAELKANLKKLKEKSEVYSKEYSELHALEIDLSFLQNSSDLFKKWEKLVGKDSVTTEKSVKKLMSKAEVIVEQAVQYESYVVKQKIYSKEKIKYKERKISYADQMKAASCATEKPSNFYEELSSINNVISKLTQKIENKKEEIQRISKTTYDKDSYKTHKAHTRGLSYKDLCREKEYASDKFAVAESTKNSFKALANHANCPTCKHEINQELSNTLYKKALKDANKYYEIITNLRKQISRYETFQELSKAKAEYERSQEQIVSLEESLNSLEKDLKKAEKEKTKLLAWEPYFEIQTKLELLEKPTKPKAPKEFNYSSEEVEYNKAVLSLGALVLPNFERYYAVKSIKTNMTLDSVKERTEYLRSKMDKVNSIIPKLTSKIDLAKQALREYEKLQERRKELKSSAEDADVLEMLVDAYSNKGLKLLLIKHIASVIEKNMNQYASLVYPEPVTFKFEVVNDREFNILRGSKRAGKTHYDDVRVLSGAESRAFSFLLPLAIMPLIPKERRLNVMVLDEPTNNMGAARMELFVKSFVPKLNQLVPHLVIISTSDEVYSNSVSYQITKKDGKSKLRKLTGG